MRKVYTGPFSPMMRMEWIEEIARSILDKKGEENLFILPTRHLLQKTRRQIIEKVNGIIGLNLVTFDDIAKHILARDKIFYQDLSRYDRRRIIKAILQEHNDHRLLAPYQNLLDSPGILSTFMGQVGEWKRNGITEDEAETIYLNENETDEKRLIALIFINYQKRLRDSDIAWMDPEERLIRATQQLNLNSSHPYLQGIKSVYVDHFTDFSVLQMNLLLAVVQQVQDVKIYLPYQPSIYEGLPNLKKTVRQTIDKMSQAGIYFESVQFLDQTVHKELIDLQQHALRRNQEPLKAPSQIEVLSACEPRREIEIVAKECKRLLVKSKSLKPSEIAIIARNPKNYHDWIHQAFMEEQIPLNYPKTVPLLEVPVVRSIFSLIGVFAENWSRSSLFTIARSPYFRWQTPPFFGLEKWAKEYGVKEGKDQWKNSVTRALLYWQKRLEEVGSHEEDEQAVSIIESRVSQLNRIERWLLEIEQLFSDWQEKETIEEWCKRIEQCISRFDWRDTFFRLQSESGYAITDWKRDLEALQQLRASLQEIAFHAKLLNDYEPVSIQEFIYDWKDLLSDKEIILEPGQGEGVLFLDPSSARGDRFHTVFIIGLNEGSFPLTFREGWWRRDRLQELKEMETLFFHMAIALAREKLILSHVSPVANERVLPSPFLEWFYEHYEKGEWQNPKRFQDAMHSGYVPAVAEITRLDEVRRLQVNYNLPLIEQEKDRYARIMNGIEIEHIRYFMPYSKWDGYLSDPLIHKRLQEIFHEDRPYSVSFINEYASCPLKFYFHRVLGVKPIEELEHEISKREQGDLLHRVLQRFYSLYKGRNLNSYRNEQLIEDLTRVFHESAAEWEESRAYINHEQWRLDKEILLAQLLEWLEHEKKQKSFSTIHPAYFEFSFGLPIDGQVDPMSRKEPIMLTWDNGKLLLYGKMDRIDEHEDGSFIIYDYKLSTYSYRGYKDVVEQLNFQLPLYLLAYAKHLQEQGIDPKPVGAGFYSLRPSERFACKGIWLKARKEEAGITANNASGLLDDLQAELDQVLLGVGNLLQELKAGAFYLIPRHRLDPYYGDRALFRTDEGLILRKYQIAKRQQQ